ncbi:MAG: tetratricopeptide repeat protein [Gammaproteobacteria bacterium]
MWANRITATLCALGLTACSSFRDLGEKQEFLTQPERELSRVERIFKPAEDCGGGLTTEQRTYLELIYKMEMQGQYYAALAHVDELEKKAESPQTFYLRAEALRQLGRLEEAEKFYQLLLGGCMTGYGLHGLGLLATESGRLDEAETYLKHACRERPTDSNIHNDYGMVLLLRNRYEPARKEFLTALQLDRNNHLPINNLLVLMLLEGRQNEAVEFADSQGVKAEDLDKLQLRAQKLKWRSTSEQESVSPSAGGNQQQIDDSSVIDEPKPEPRGDVSNDSTPSSDSSASTPDQLQSVDTLSAPLDQADVDYDSDDNGMRKSENGSPASTQPQHSENTPVTSEKAETVNELSGSSDTQTENSSPASEPSPKDKEKSAPVEPALPINGSPDDGAFQRDNYLPISEPPRQDEHQSAPIENVDIATNAPNDGSPQIENNLTSSVQAQTDLATPVIIDEINNDGELLIKGSPQIDDTVLESVETQVVDSQLGTSDQAAGGDNALSDAPRLDADIPNNSESQVEIDLPAIVVPVAENEDVTTEDSYHPGSPQLEKLLETNSNPLDNETPKTSAKNSSSETDNPTATDDAAKFTVNTSGNAQAGNNPAGNADEKSDNP